MAIDKDRKTAWVSEPDGVTPKVLSIDMKDLKRTDRVTVWTPDPKRNAPIRMTIEGSDDGRLWFRLASTHPDAKVQPVAGEVGPMTARIFEGTDAHGYSNWDQVVALTKNVKPTLEGKAADLFWTRQPDDKAKRPAAAVWHGKVVQPKSGPVRVAVLGEKSAVMVDGRLELPVGPGNRTIDVYLDAGTHAVTLFAACGPNTNTLEARWASGDVVSELVEPAPFRAIDFDLDRPEAKTIGLVRPLGEAVADKDGTSWDFKFPAINVRHTRLVVHEYRGEAVAINHVEIRDSEKNVLHIPTDADLLSLATNDILEIAGGDIVTATYIDEVNTTGAARLLTAKLSATYYNGTIVPIAYDFLKMSAGDVYTVRKELLRIDPGERIVIEVTDFDMDVTAAPDKIKVQVSVNNGPPIDLEATETQENSGVFTKEVDTSATPAEGKIVVKPGDRIYLRYLDQQNTVPGHATVREAVVYVNEPTAGRVRVVETRGDSPDTSPRRTARRPDAAGPLPAAAIRRTRPQDRLRRRLRSALHHRSHRPRRGQGQPQQGDGHSQDQQRRGDRSRVRPRRPPARHERLLRPLRHRPPGRALHRPGHHATGRQGKSVAGPAHRLHAARPHRRAGDAEGRGERCGQGARQDAHHQSAQPERLGHR